MKFEDVQVYGFKPAIKFMRNPLKSYAKADSDFSQPDGSDFVIGPADYDLAKRLCKGGSVHSKWMRMVYVWVNITAPLYVWSEFDTYSHVPKSSESTMHTAFKEEFDVMDCFAPSDDLDVYDAYAEVSNHLANLQKQYKEADNVEDKNRIRWDMKKIIPSGYLQKRGVCLNYETLSLMYEQRKDHRLPEWSVDFVNFIDTLPYNEFIKRTGFAE